MKALVLTILSVMMITPAMAFDQTDLDHVNSFQELNDVPNFEFEGFASNGKKSINKNFFGRRRFVCVSKNRRGLRFKAQGPNHRRVRRRAMRKCRRNSHRPRSCQVVRCRRKGGKFNDLIDLIDLIDSLN